MTATWPTHPTTPMRRLASPARRASALRLARVGLTVLFGSLAIINGQAAINAEETGRAHLHLATAGFLIYLLIECQVHLARSDAFGLLAPPFLASVFHFLFAYALGVSGTLLDPWILERFVIYQGGDPESLTNAIFLAWLAAFVMWRAYYASRAAARPIRRWLMQAPSIRKTFAPRFELVIIIQAAYFGLVVVAIGLGIFGMAGSHAARHANITILEILRLSLAAGTLSFFLILTRYFERRAAGQATWGFGVACLMLGGLHILFGALSGFKSQIIMPFLIVLLARFVATQRIGMVYIFGGFLALLAAYEVVEPFRAYLAKNDLRGEMSIGSLTEALNKSMEQKELYTHDSSISRTTQIISRLDLLGLTSVGVAYAQNGQVEQMFSDWLKESIYLAPILAFVPRLLWSDKGSYSTGIWFNQHVLGKWHDSTTSVGMGPIAQLYMASGLAGVVLGFMFLGFLQAILFEGVARSGPGGLVIYFSAIQTLVLIPTAFGPAITGMLRVLPFAFLAQLLMLRAPRVSSRSTARGR